MAGTLTVQNIQGPTSGDNANKIIVPSGHTLDASGGTLIPSEGAIVQVVQDVTTSMTTVSSSASLTYGDMHSLTITPKYATSKILLLSSYGYGDASAAGGGGVTRYLRDSTVIANFNINWMSTSSVAAFYAVASHCYLDSPATTSSITYKLQGTTQQSDDNFLYNATFTGHTNMAASFTAMEIAQ